jgi:hypothetical protein
VVVKSSTQPQQKLPSLLSAHLLVQSGAQSAAAAAEAAAQVTAIAVATAIAKAAANVSVTGPIRDPDLVSAVTWDALRGDRAMHLTTLHRRGLTDLDACMSSNALALQPLQTLPNHFRSTA